MKKTRTIVVALIAVFTLCCMILPATGDETPDVIKAGSMGSGSFTGLAAISQKSAVNSAYLPLTVPIGKPLVFTLAATDPDNNTLIYSASNLPPGATFDPLTGSFSWTPVQGQAGIYTGVHFEVSDGELTDSEDITINVIPAGDSTPNDEAAVFSVSALSINPLKVNAGKKVNIRVTASNTGSVAGEYEVTLMVNGSIEDVRVVSVSPGTSVVVSFTSVQNDPGVYEVDVNGLTGSFEVKGSSNKVPGRKVSSF